MNIMFKIYIANYFVFSTPTPPQDISLIMHYVVGTGLLCCPRSSITVALRCASLVVING